VEQSPSPPVAIDDATWPAQARAARISMRPLTALLVVVLIAVAAVLAGAKLEKRQGGGTPAASAASRFAAGGFANRAGATAGGSAGAATASDISTGTVTQISSKLLYLTSSTGALVKVKLTSATTFTRTAKSSKGGIVLGDTAIARGTKNAQGVLVATTVIATAKGVTSTFGGGGGFGGGGFGGAGRGAGGTAAAGG
jgi:hypothetical protein